MQLDMPYLVTLTGRIILFGRETKEEWHQGSRGEVAWRDWEKGETVVRCIIIIIVFSIQKNMKFMLTSNKIFLVYINNYIINYSRPY